MTMASTRLAAGPGWRVFDVRCSAGPQDPVAEERHGSFCLAAVVAGTFQYRAPTGQALLAPGAVMLGNQGQCFECGHEHGHGDRCLSVHFDAACWEAIVAAVPGARSATFALPRLPPMPELLPFASGLATRTDALALEELAFGFAGAALEAITGQAGTGRIPARDERRIAASVRRIEQALDAPLPLARLAADAAMSPYHYLRTFTRVVGTTPHRFVLRARLERAARLLRKSRASVAEVALEAGFGDLSTFHASFRRWLGTTPAAYRAGATNA
ncbi:AraC family transcriptional regulator [Fulvimonas yonginensis]|uniref:AraC family transcriptional regulator n=1 Tax=Fulvimonas yonginensis TaxID=1495200 RepID=A0ABU8JDM7_9GAMM